MSENAPPYGVLPPEMESVPKEVLESREKALNYALSLGDELKSKDEGLGAILTEIFEITTEKKLIQPTFITQYPTEVSPLSRPRFSVGPRWVRGSGRRRI